MKKIQTPAFNLPVDTENIIWHSLRLSNVEDENLPVNKIHKFINDRTQNKIRYIKSSAFLHFNTQTGQAFVYFAERIKK